MAAHPVKERRFEMLYPSHCHCAGFPDGALYLTLSFTNWHLHPSTLDL